MANDTPLSPDQSIPQTEESNPRPPRATGAFQRLPDGSVLRAKLDPDGTVFLFRHGAAENHLAIQREHLHLLIRMVEDADREMPYAGDEGEGA